MAKKNFSIIPNQLVKGSGLPKNSGLKRLAIKASEQKEGN